METPETIPFQLVIDALLDPARPVLGISHYRLSELTASELGQLERAWPAIPLQHRIDLLADLEEYATDDPLLFFDGIGRIGLKDTDPQVRLAAIQLVAVEESPEVLPALRKIIEDDANLEVQVGGLEALAPYIYFGEIEALPQREHQANQALLLRLYRTASEPLIRQRTLEAFGYTSHPELPGMIEDAFSRDDEDWQASALLAMGRSADQKWKEIVTQMLDHDSALLREQAACAAGALGLEEAKPELFSLAADESSEEVRRAALWSLSEIGGGEVQAFLKELLEDAITEEEAEYLEDVLENLIEIQLLSDTDLLMFDLDDDDAELPDDEPDGEN